MIGAISTSMKGKFGLPTWASIFDLKKMGNDPPLSGQCWYLKDWVPYFL